MGTIPGRRKVNEPMASMLTGSLTVAIRRDRVTHKIRKGQFDTTEMKLEGAGAGELWQTVVAA